MSLVAMGAAEEHELGAILTNGQLFDVGKELPAKTPASHGLLYHNVLNDAEGLKTIHDIGADRQERGGADGSISLGNEEKAGWCFGESRKLPGENADVWVVDQLAIEVPNGDRVFHGGPPDHEGRRLLKNGGTLFHGTHRTVSRF